MKSIFLFLLFGLFPNLIFAAGQQEKEIVQAKTLIEEKKYDEAILLLTKVWQEDPKKAAEVQKYFDLILREKRQRINYLKQEILEKMRGDYDEEVLLFMEELYRIDPEESKGWIEQTRILWRIIKIYKEFVQLMDIAQQLISQKKYEEAANIYLKVFNLQQDDFYENAQYPNILKNQVSLIIDKTNNYVRNILSLFSLINTELRAVADLLNQAKINEALYRFYTSYNNLINFLSQRRNLYTEAQKLVTINNEIKKISPDKKGDNFISFSIQAIMGRFENSQPEGLSYLIEFYWFTESSNLLILLNSQLDRQFQLAIEAYQKNLWESTVSYLNSTKQLVKGLLNFQSLTLALLEKLDFKENYLKKINTNDIVYIIKAQEKHVEIKQVLRFIDFQNTYTRLKNLATSSAADNTNNRLALKNSIKDLIQQKNYWEKRNLYLLALENENKSQPQVRSSISFIQKEINTIYNLFSGLDLQLATEMLEKEKNVLAKNMSDLKDRYEQSKKFSEGIKGTDGIIRKYPTQAKKLLELLSTEVLTYKNLLDSSIVRWAAESDYVLKDNKIQTYLNEIKKLQTNTLALNASITAEIKKALDQATRALSFMNQGDFEYRQAKLFYNKKNYYQARESLNRAINAYTNSLLNEENEQLRSLLDKEVKPFIEIIYQTVLLERLAEIRKNIDEGIFLYNLTSFEAAEKKFNYAKKLQTELFEDPTYKDEEIENWLNLVERALKSQPKREILEKDPGYAEMTKRLNLANEEFYKGLAEQAEKNNSLATKHFNNALQLISQIKNQYPYHRESGVLYLKIQLSIKGDEQFRKEMSAFLEKAKTEPNLQKALADLKDLQEIDPNFPGLRQLIAQIEARLYPKQEVNEEAIAESNRLANQAKLLYDTKQRENYKEALLILNRSLFLNSNNTLAQNLKTRILQELNSGADYPISDNDQRLLLEAERLVLQGDILGANAILQQLWLNSLNRANPKIINLKNRIEASL